jgi:hypothetical protein
MTKHLPAQVVQESRADLDGQIVVPKADEGCHDCPADQQPEHPGEDLGVPGHNRLIN